MSKQGLQDWNPSLKAPTLEVALCCAETGPGEDAWLSDTTVMTAAGEGGNLDRDQVSDTIVCHVSVGLGLGSSWAVWIPVVSCLHALYADYY